MDAGPVLRRTVLECPVDPAPALQYRHNRTVVVGRILDRPTLEQSSRTDALRWRSQRLLGRTNYFGGVTSFRSQTRPGVAAVVAAANADRAEATVHAEQIDGTSVFEEIGRETMVDMGQNRPALTLIARAVEACQTLLVLDAAGRSGPVIVERDQEIAIVEKHDAGIVQVDIGGRILIRDLGKVHAIALPLALRLQRLCVGSRRR